MPPKKSSSIQSSTSRSGSSRRSRSSSSKRLTNPQIIASLMMSSAKISDMTDKAVIGRGEFDEFYLT